MSHHIAWFTEGTVGQAPDGGFTSALASARYRCVIPARELGKLGLHSSIFGDISRRDPERLCRTLFEQDVRSAIIGNYPDASVVRLARAMRRHGIFLIADFCDDFFDDPRFGIWQRELIELADRLAASTPQLAESIERNTGRSSTVIPDPYEGIWGAPKFAPVPDRLEILWFGNHNNVPTLEPLMPQLASLREKQTLRLTIVTGLDRVKVLAKSRPNFMLNPVEWSVEELGRQLAACDVVVIPSLDTPHYLAKSANRLIEALHAGRAVAAHPIPSYREFGDVCWLGENITEGIAWMLCNRETVERQIAKGQALIAERYASDIIASQWLEFWQSAPLGMRV